MTNGAHQRYQFTACDDKYIVDHQSALQLAYMSMVVMSAKELASASLAIPWD